jgi:hypothetical protein
MLLRIALIIAILAGIGTAVLNFVKVKESVTVIMAARDKNLKDYQSETAAHGKTKKDLAQTKQDLDNTKRKLTDTQGERDTAVAEADKQRKQAEGLAANLKETTAKWTEADRKLAAYRVAGLTPEEIVTLRGTLKTLTSDREDLARKRDDLTRALTMAQAELERYRDPEWSVPLPSDLRGAVVAVDPKYDFVVLNFGQKQGALPEGIMLVSRDGKLVAKIRLKQVEPERTVANVLPGWKIADVMEGDLAVTRQ